MELRADVVPKTAEVSRIQSTSTQQRFPAPSNAPAKTSPSFTAARRLHARGARASCGERVGPSSGSPRALACV